MCGICGAINFNSLSNESIVKAKALIEPLKFRGPDASGFFSDQHVAFGHTRLAIIDLVPESNQPMFSSCKEIVIVFNGEIYNFKELRAELENEFDFKTKGSDTEVILYAYKKWGIGCLEKFVGMFAFCLYDIKKKKAYLVRDRLGKKPLFYAIQNDTLFFSSESNSFFLANILSKRVSESAIFHYLSMLTVDAPSSFFENVYKLPAGNYIEIDYSNKLNHNEYWSITEYLNRKSDDDYNSAIDKTEQLLNASMKYRNIADVPIAVALSGGLDSSLNLYYSKLYSSSNIFAININYSSYSAYDESLIASRFAKELGVNYIQETISEESYANLIKEYFMVQADTPIGDPNSPLLYAISKIARKHDAKVLIVGEGGDEIGGYPLYNKYKLYHQLVRFLPKSLLNLVSSFPLPRLLARELSVLVEGGVPARRMLFGFSDKEKCSSWLGHPIKENTFHYLSRYSNQIQKTFGDSLLRSLLNIEYKVRLPEILLPRTDYPSMAASVEARAPFMDHSLIEYSAMLGFNVKMKYGAKSILKEIAKNKLPKYILEGPKVGFGMLLTPFLNDTISEWFKAEILLADSPLYRFLSREFLESAYVFNKKYKKDGYRLWVLYSLHRWLMVHEGPK